MLRLASQSRICGGGTVGAWFGGPPLGGFRGEPHKLELRRLRLVTQTLLMPMRLHAFSALVLGNF